MASARGLSEPYTLRDGRPALIRAIRPDDRERLAAAFLALEPESVYLRYFSYKRELTSADLDRLSMPDFRERVVLVVTLGSGGDEVIIASGGHVVHAAADGARSAEVAFAVEEDFQGNGIATRLLAVLADIARADGIARFDAEVLLRNGAMLQVFARSGLAMQQDAEDDGVVRLTLALRPASSALASR
jgi:RimJ/RimL family protein N-acetyltransferase